MFRKITATDIPLLVDLAKESWTEHYTAIIGEAQVIYMLNKFNSANAIAAQIQDESYHYYFIELNDKPVGYFVVQVKDGELFLSKFYVAANQRGNGVGKQTLQFIITLAKQFQLKKIALTVNRHNSNSIAAYYKLGFIKTGEVCIDIGNSFVMDDFMMELSV